MERITDSHIYFWSSELSNWHMCKFEYKGHPFYNSEQAFMWEKALYFKDDLVARRILQEPDPKKSKKLGREVRNFDRYEWSKVCFDIMVSVNLAKFSSTWTLKRILLDTKPKILVEASPLDTIWGIGLHWSDDKVLDEKNWKGENLLGKALMEVRNKL